VIRQRFNRLAMRCRLPRIRLHDLRHSYATAALKSGVNPKIVSQRFGHASVGFTLSVYSHALPGADREAATAIANLILGDDQAGTAQAGDREGVISKSASKGHENAPGDYLSEGIFPGSGDRI
jgi:hypothetical protein